MKKLIVVLLTALSFTSCTKTGIYVPVSNAADNFNVQFLFEVDGAKVYRFEDNGYSHYFITKANGETITAHRSGKVIYHDDIETSYTDRGDE